MGTKKLEHLINKTNNLSIVKRSQTFSTKTLINSLVPNFKIKNSLGEYSSVIQAIV